MNYGINIILLAIIAVLLALILVSRNKNRTAAKQETAEILDLSSAPPAPPAASEESPVYLLSLALSDSIPPFYKQAVKQRVMNQHPDMTEREYEWRWLEMQRFFLMCAVLDRVPMFSRAVDEVWHEMLMYTRDYQAFSEKYMGRMLHHTPNSEESVPDSGARAWFDLIYVELFGWNPYSELLWGRFFQHPVPKQRLESCSRSVSKLPKDGRFNAWTYENMPRAKEAIDHVILNLQSRIQTAKNSKADTRNVNYASPEILLGSVIYFSLYDPDHFSDRMLREVSARKDSSGSACSSGSGGVGTE